MQGVREKIAGFVRRRHDAIEGPLSRLRARLARMPAGRRPIVVVSFGAGAVAVVVVLIVAGLAVLAPGEQAVGPRGSAGVPLPTAGPGPDAPPVADVVAEAKPQPGGGLSVPAATAEAFAHVRPVREVTALAEDADADLLEITDEGLSVPRPAADGRVPWRHYARPFDREDPRPRIVIVIAGLGLGAAATAAAIERMPGAVSLAFDASAGDVGSHLRAARRFGHETLAMLPLESADFPFEDLGPGTLKAEAEEAENLRRLNTVLASAPASVGVLAIGGTRFARAEAAVRPILRALADRGLLFADASGGATALLAAEAARLDVPRVVIDMVIDEQLDVAAIDARLAELESQARQSHVAVGLARPLPVTLGRLREWIETLAEKRLVLAPLSGVVGTQVRTQSLGAGR